MQDHQKSTTDHIKDEVGEIAENTRDRIEAKARLEAETAKATAASEAQKAANAASAAAAEFDPNSLQARAIEQLAMRIEGVADEIRGADIDRLARTVRGTAEKNPLMFVAGAALAGFALSRFLGARPEARVPAPSHGYSDPWSTARADYAERDYDLSSRGGV